MRSVLARLEGRKDLLYIPRDQLPLKEPGICFHIVSSAGVGVEVGDGVGGVDRRPAQRPFRDGASGLRILSAPEGGAHITSFLRKYCRL